MQIYFEVATKENTALINIVTVVVIKAARRIVSVRVNCAIMDQHHTNSTTQYTTNGRLMPPAVSRLPTRNHTG